MAASVGVSCRCSSVVFVGNIPYHATESELRDACEEIGPVVSLRLAADKDTGKPRGFAFAEYLDDETARSACRNLDGHPLRGRPLRVGLADLRSRRVAGDGGEAVVVGVEDATHAAASLVSAPPSDAVTAYLAGMSRREMREMLEAVEAEGEVVVEEMKRRYKGFGTLIEQARILVVDMAAGGDDSEKVKGKKRGKRGHRDEAAQVEAAGKLRKLDDDGRRL